MATVHASVELAHHGGYLCLLTHALQVALLEHNILAHVLLQLHLHATGVGEGDCTNAL